MITGIRHRRRQADDGERIQPQRLAGMEDQRAADEAQVRRVSQEDVGLNDVHRSLP